MFLLLVSVTFYRCIENHFCHISRLSQKSYPNIKTSHWWHLYVILMAQISKNILKDGALMGISCLQYSIPLSPFYSYNRKESYKTTAANVTLWKRLRIR